MPETRTYQGQTYQRNAPGEPWVRVGGRRGGFIPDPYAASEEQRAEQDQGFEERRVAVAEANAARQNDIAARQADIDERKVAIDERQANLTPGQKKADEAFATDYAEWNAAGGYAQLESQLSVLDDALELLEGGEEISGPLFGRMPKFIQQMVNPVSQDVRADIERSIQASLRQTLGAQFTEKEGENLLARTFDPTQSEQSNARRLRNLISEMRSQGKAKEEAGRYFEEHGTIAGWTPPNASSTPNGGPPPAAAGMGATEQSTPVPAEMQQSYSGYIGANWGKLDPEKYAAFRESLDMQYGFGSGKDYRAEAERLNSYAADGIPASAIPSIPSINAPLEGFDKFRNDIVSDPSGAALTGIMNAGGFGLPSLLASDEYDAMRDLNPAATFTGELFGGLSGTALASKALTLAAPRATGSVAALLANPVTADVGYGTAYGATQADDPLYGAVFGGATALGGNWLGNKIGSRFAARGAEDTMTPGERAVFNAIPERDPVLEALAQADELSVPASLADVSPGVNSLTGAAIRRSPTVAGDARNTLGTRARGQYDRFLGAVERDLGPVGNVPQRSEDLITQAKAAAAPLYDRAYAAPGAELVKLDDLADRPTFSAALREAYNEVLDEGLDPSAIGLQVAGDDILVASPSWQTLDYVKRGLDNLIERGTSKIDGTSPDARRAIQMRNTLLSRMDEANPDYAAARAAYAGPMQERTALQAGREALRVSPNQLGVDVAKVSPAQAGQMRLGFQSGLAEGGGRVRNSTNPFNLLDTPAMEQRIAALGYDGDDVARLLLNRDMERDLAASTNRLIGNSMTAERQVADEAFGASSLMGDAGPMVVETAISGAPIATGLRSVAGRLSGQGLRDWRALGLGRRAIDLADEIGPIALNTNPAVSRDVLLDLAAKDAAYNEIVQALMAGASTGGHIGTVAAVNPVIEALR